MKVSRPDMAAVVRQLSVNPHFLRRVVVKYRLVQSLSGSFPLWERLKLYKFDERNADTYLLKLPASTLSEENYSQNNKCHAVVT